MPQGDKSSYTAKQKRQAENIEESYEKSGISKGEAAKRAWKTVNKTTGGGKIRAPKKATKRSATAKTRSKKSR